MNIYHIGWVHDDQFGLGAVVIAGTEEEALKALDLDDSYNSEIRISLMGVCTDGTKTAQIVCQESL
jgi:malic enzyme